MSEVVIDRLSRTTLERICGHCGPLDAAPGRHATEPAVMAPSLASSRDYIKCLLDSPVRGDTLAKLLTSERRQLVTGGADRKGHPTAELV